MLWATLGRLYLYFHRCQPVAQRPRYPKASAAAHQYSAAWAWRAPVIGRAIWKVCRSCATQGRHLVVVPVAPIERIGGHQLDYPIDGTTLLPLLPRYQQEPCVHFLVGYRAFFLLKK
jgi:hypothetical protein